MLNQSNQPPVNNFPLLMSKLYGHSEQDRIAVLPELLKYGQIGEDLLVKIIETEGGEIQNAAINLIFTAARNKVYQLSNEISQANKNIEIITKKLDEKRDSIESEIQALNVKMQKLESEIKTILEAKKFLEHQKYLLDRDRKIKEDAEKGKIKKQIKQQKKQIQQIRQSLKSSLLKLTINCQNYNDINMISNLEEKFIFFNLKNLIAESLNINLEKVTLNANLAFDLGANEYDGTELIIKIEKDFDIEITDNDMFQYLQKIAYYPDYTVKEIVDLILLKTKNVNPVL